MSLYWEQAGEGSPVVLVHEAIGDRRMWEPQWQTFPRAHRTVRYDMRGFGDSPIGPGTYSHARDLADLLDELGLEQTSLVAGSLGGRVALEVAVDRPDRIEKLVLVNPGGPAGEWSEETQAGWAEEEAALERGDLDAAVEVNLRMWVDGPHRSPEDVDQGVRALVARMQRRSFELQLPVAEEAEEELLVDDLAARVSGLSVPTLVVAGELDQPDILAIGDRLAKEIPGAQHATIPDAAHAPNLEQPEEFDRLVLEFLR